MFTYLPADAILKVDLAAIQKNYAYMNSLTGPAVTHAAVVKSDAYGLGLVPVAKTLERAGCRSFFVADLEEGFQALPEVRRALCFQERGQLVRWKVESPVEQLVELASCLIRRHVSSARLRKLPSPAPRGI